jgi:hypothetical protein
MSVPGGEERVKGGILWVVVLKVVFAWAIVGVVAREMVRSVMRCCSWMGMSIV